MASIKKKDIARFQKIAKSLDELIKDIQKYCPAANIYIAMNDLYLMKDETHDDWDKPQYENVVSSYPINNMDGGDW